MPSPQNLPQRFASLRWRFTQSLRAHVAQFRHEHLWSYARGKPHSLPGQLIVSLTSYAPRFATLHLTLRCLLNQSVAADEVVLWIDIEDKNALPASVLAFDGDILKIRFSDRKLRSYTKIVPSLDQYPDAYIVTADDDIYYEHKWLEGLVTAHDEGRPAIVCHRAHQPYFRDTEQLAPYADWDWEIAGPRDSDNLFPTGVGGVLYPPGILPALTLDADLFLRLAPSADDVWLYFMGRRAGARYKLSGCRFRALDWPGSQRATLNGNNVGLGGNDRQIRMLEDAIGLARRH